MEEWCYLEVEEDILDASPNKNRHHSGHKISIVDLGREWTKINVYHAKQWKLCGEIELVATKKRLWTYRCIQIKLVS